MRRGSVILEFVLMMPVLLLLFGGTLLTYEIFVGKLRLQEANRNHAWLAGDRYGVSGDDINNLVKSYFLDRNKRERAVDPSGGDFWTSFGGGSHNVSRKQFGDGHYVGETPWSRLVVGNMVVKMDKVSAAYIGAIAASSVLQGNGEDDNKALYRAKYDISYTPDPGDDGDLSGDSFSPESYVLRRFPRNDKNEDEAKYRHDRYVEDIWRISLEPWPKMETTDMVAPDDGTATAEAYKRTLYNYTQ